MIRSGAIRGTICCASVALATRLASSTVGCAPFAREVGRPAAADDDLAGAELLERDHPVGMLDEVADQGRRRLGDVHVQGFGLRRDRNAEPRRQRLAARSGSEHHPARFYRPVSRLDDEALALAPDRPGALALDQHDALFDDPAADRGVGEQRIELAFIGANLGADHVGSEIGRDAIEFRAIEDIDIEPQFALAPGLDLQEIELVPALRDHQAAGHLQVEIRPEPRLHGLPEGNRLGIERKLALHARHVLRIEAHEAALHLDMKTAGIGVRAADAPVVDQGDADTVLGQKACKA